MQAKTKSEDKRTGANCPQCAEPYYICFSLNVWRCTACGFVSLPIEEIKKEYEKSKR